MKAFVQGQTTRVWPSGDSWLPTQGSLQRKDYASFSPWFPNHHSCYHLCGIIIKSVSFWGEKK